MAETGTDGERIERGRGRKERKEQVRDRTWVKRGECEVARGWVKKVVRVKEGERDVEKVGRDDAAEKEREQKGHKFHYECFFVNSLHQRKTFSVLII